MYLIAGRGRRKDTSQQRKPADTDTQSQRQLPGDSPYSEHTPASALAEFPDFAGAGAGIDSDADTDAHFDETALDDPDLLSEFEALRAEMGHTERQRPLPALPKSNRVEQGHLASAHQGSDSEAGLVNAPEHIEAFDEDDQALDNVVVTEEDMNDPLLLAELSKIFGESQKHVPESAKVALNTEEHTADKQPERELEAKSKEEEVSDTRADDTQNAEKLRVLAERETQFKAAALAAKRAGNMESARRMLVQMKDTQSAIKILESGQSLPPGYTIPAQPQLPVAEAKHAPVPAPPKIPSKKAEPKLPKHANIPAAPRNAEPRLREIASDSRGQGFEEIATSFAAMKSRLESQAKEATRLSAYFLKAGDKPTALEFHRLKKRAVADIASVTSFEANGRTLPPPFLHREVQWTAPDEQQRRDISASEMQVSIGRVVSNGELAVTLGGQSDFFIQWESSWPRDRGLKAYTRTIKYKEFEESQGDLDIGYSRNVEFVDRNVIRPLVRWAERGKLVIELYKYMGILWGSQLIGRASLPLAGLRTKAEVAGLVEIKAVSSSLARTERSLPGGPVFVDVAARLRLPLSNKPEMVVHSERWIYIDTQQQQQNQEQVVARVQPQGPVVTTATEAISAVDDTVPDTLGVRMPEQQVTNVQPPLPQDVSPQKPPVSAVEPVAAQTSSGAIAHEKPEPDSEVDDIAAHLDSMESVLSNAVLEFELLQIPARMREAHGNKSVVLDLQDLEASIKLRMSVVAAQVGAGTLTIDDYMGGVEKEIVQNKAWALAAKKQGKMDLAMRALKRVKAMQSEISEMKAAMEAGDE